MPTRISAPAAARDFAIAQPYPLSSATPAMKALLPAYHITFSGMPQRIKDIKKVVRKKLHLAITNL